MRASRRARAPAARRVAAIAACLSAISFGGGEALAQPVSSPRETTLSSNWAGYAISGTQRAPVRFKSVAARWVQPSVACTATPSYSGFWVGLGGYRQPAQALEQIGTEADCRASGTPSYFAWYELVPKASVRIPLKIRPGDVIAAAVTVSGRRVKLSLRDLSTGASSGKTIVASVVDVSSAEWIAEAPSICAGQASCRVLPLANFGTVSFSNSSAVSTAGQSGTIGAAQWAPTALEMLDLGGGGGRARFRGSTPVTAATPTNLFSGGSAFAVSWRQASAPTATPPPIGVSAARQALGPASASGPRPRLGEAL